MFDSMVHHKSLAESLSQSLHGLFYLFGQNQSLAIFTESEPGLFDQNPSLVFFIRTRAWSLSSESDPGLFHQNQSLVFFIRIRAWSFSSE